MNTKISAIATYIPDNKLTNSQLAIDFPSWNMSLVEKRSGVRVRHIADRKQTAFDLSKQCCDKLPKNLLEDIDAIIYCTQSPDYIIPGNAHLLHNYLKLPDSVAVFDMNFACSGFVYGMATAHSILCSSLATKVLLITSDTYSKHIAPNDRSARVLFGDGAAAIIFENCSSENGVLTFDLRSHGAKFDSFYIPGGGHKNPIHNSINSLDQNEFISNRSSNFIKMDGLSVWSFVNTAVPKQINDYLKRINVEIDDVDLFFFHQASAMMIESLTKILSIDPKKVIIDMENIGNIVSASIPTSIANSLKEGKLYLGQKILICGFGSGLSYGTTLYNYNEKINVY